MMSPGENGERFMPRITYGSPESAYKGVFETISEQLESQSALYF